MLPRSRITLVGQSVEMLLFIPSPFSHNEHVGPPKVNARSLEAASSFRMLWPTATDKGQLHALRRDGPDLSCHQALRGETFCRQLWPDLSCPQALRGGHFAVNYGLTCCVPKP